MKDNFKKGFVLIAVLLFCEYVDAQVDSSLTAVEIIIDTTAFGYDMEEDTSATENLLLEGFMVEFNTDSIAVNPDSLIYGVFHISFLLKYPLNFGAVQIEVAKLLPDNSTMLMNSASYTSTELLTAEFLVLNSADITVEGIITPGTYIISLMPMSTEGATARILTQTIFL